MGQLWGLLVGCSPERPSQDQSSNSQFYLDPILQRGETVRAGEAGHSPFGQGGSPLRCVSTTGPRQGTEPKSQGTRTGRDMGAGQDVYSYGVTS